MAHKIGTPERPLFVAVIGAGPAGFYTADALIDQENVSVRVDLIERLPAPYGLVRYGVAPDHLHTKRVKRRYNQTAESNPVRYLGNVDFGKDFTHEELLAHYDMVVYSTGAQSDRQMHIPGESLFGSIAATYFVAWYNGHPYFSHIKMDLDCESVAVIGVGNVALDVARILAKSRSELHHSDIAVHALDRLEHSKVKDIYIIGRRGPVQAKWTTPELKEMANLEIADVVVDPAELEIDPVSQKILDEDRSARRNFEILKKFAETPLSGKPRRIHFKFLQSPVEIHGQNGTVSGITLGKNRLEPGSGDYMNAVSTGETEYLPVQMVLRSIGYKGVALPGVPFDEKGGVIPNAEGRILDSTTGVHLPGEYVAGWIKRGPTGVIGTNKVDARETVQRMFDDLASLPETDSIPPDLTDLLDARDIPYMEFSHWKILDQQEVERGEEVGRPRIKFVDTEMMLKIVMSMKSA